MAYKHDDPSYIKTTWQARLEQLKGLGKDPGPVYIITEYTAKDHNGNNVIIRDVHCELATLHEVSGDCWAYADAESAKRFL